MTEAAVPVEVAARRVLADDGRAFNLLPWQIAYCVAVVDGREPVVPPGCGVGKGWLEARLSEAAEEPLARDAEVAGGVSRAGSGE